MADSSMPAHALLATLAWLCLRMFPNSKWLSKLPAIMDKVSQGGTNSDQIDSVPSLSGRAAVNISSTVTNRQRRLVEKYLRSVHNGNVDVELKVRIFLDLRNTARQDAQQFIHRMSRDGFEDEIQIVPSSGTVFATKVRVEEDLSALLTRLLLGASRLEERSTLQVGSWGVFYMAGDQPQLLKFEDGHGIPEIHRVSHVATRILMIRGQHLRGAEITAIVNSNTVLPITLFWPKEEEAELAMADQDLRLRLQRARESEVLLATLPEHGLEELDTFIIQAVKTLSQDGLSVLVRSESAPLQLTPPLVLALRGLQDAMSLQSGWPVLVLLLLLGKFSYHLLNTLLTVPAVWVAAWFFVQLLPEHTIRSLRIYCTRIWEDAVSPATAQVHSKDAEGPILTHRESIRRNTEDETGVQQLETARALTDRKPPDMTGPASSQVPLYIQTAEIYDTTSAAKWFSPQHLYRKPDSTEDVKLHLQSQKAALHEKSDKKSSASHSSPFALAAAEITVPVDSEDHDHSIAVSEDHDHSSGPQTQDSHKRDFSSVDPFSNVDSPTEISWGNGSSQILLDTPPGEYSFPSIDDDDLMKFFPEKCKLEPATPLHTFPPAGMELGNATSTPSRFSMRSLLSRLRASQFNNTGSSKDDVQTMSSVIISHRPDSASHTVVAAFDATKKLTFEAVDWGLLQMDLWPGDTLVVLGVITKIRSPLGIEVLADLNGFSGLNPRVLEHEIAQRLMDYQKKLLARRLYCQKKGLNLEVRITAGHPLRNVVANEVIQMQATWAVMDKHLSTPARFCLQKCSCGVVLMDKKTNIGQFLRMAQQPSLTDPLYGGKYVRRQYTTAPIRFEDYEFEHPEAQDLHRYSPGSPCASVSNTSAPSSELHELASNYSNF